MERQLWDLQWIEDGCKGDYPPGTNTDDTVGTYVTDYLIGIVGIWAAVIICLNGQASNKYKILGSNSFIWQALGYALAGVLHQVFHEDEEHQDHEGLWKTSYILVLISMMFTGFLTNELLADKFPGVQGTCQMVLNVVIGLFVGAVIIQTAIEPMLILTGAASGVIVLYLCVVFGLRCQWLGVAGSLLQIAGFLVQIALAPACGDAAYQDCFRDCPLPAPTFNHNALFHVLYAIGMVLVAISLVQKPVTTSPEKIGLMGQE